MESINVPEPDVTVQQHYYVPEVTCGGSTGRRMPVLGMGTATYPFAGSEGVKQALLQAIKLGYRHFDTAAVYHTEPYLGGAISEALQLGLIKSRDELFITSKLWCSDAHSDRVLPALQNTLRNLQLEYLDLYLVHWPLSLKPGKYEYPVSEEDLLPMDFESVWSAMEECHRLGLTKSIGVSNFSCKKLENILAVAKISPAVNQVEMNPLWQQKKLREFCKTKGIVITAYSPLGAKGTGWGSDRVMECEVLHEIAKAKGKSHAQVEMNPLWQQKKLMEFCKAKGITITAYSPLGAKGTSWGTDRVVACEVLHQIAKTKGKSHAQVCLRWVFEQGVSLLVKSFNKERMKENLEIFDWELNSEDLKKISEIPQVRGLPVDGFLSPNGPFKSEEEFWDGEI